MLLTFGRKTLIFDYFELFWCVRKTLILDYFELFSCSRDVGWIQERTEAGQEPTLIFSQAKNQLQKSTPQKINSKNQLSQKSTPKINKKSTPKINYSVSPVPLRFIKSGQKSTILAISRKPYSFKNQLFCSFSKNQILQKINFSKMEVGVPSDIPTSTGLPLYIIHQLGRKELTEK